MKAQFNVVNVSLRQVQEDDASTPPKRVTVDKLIVVLKPAANATIARESTIVVALEKTEAAKYTIGKTVDIEVAV